MAHPLNYQISHCWEKASPHPHYQNKIDSKLNKIYQALFSFFSHKIWCRIFISLFIYPTHLTLVLLWLLDMQCLLGFCPVTGVRVNTMSSKQLGYCCFWDWDHLEPYYYFFLFWWTSVFLINADKMLEMSLFTYEARKTYIAKYHRDI